MTREEVCRATSKKLTAAAGRLGDIKVVVGLDGFVDNIIAVVDKRLSPTKYEAVKTIASMGEKISKAAGQSSNYELVIKQQKLGGNGPIMGNALAAAGMKVTYIGNLGYPKHHSVFDEFAKRAEIITIAEPGYTDALEFEDGKLMLGKHQALADVNWENITARVGKSRLQAMVEEASLLGFLNWTMLPHLSDIWSKLHDEVFAGLKPKNRKLFVDLCDPEKRTKQDLLNAMKIVTRFQEQMDVVLGLNLKESNQLADVLGLRANNDPESAIEQTARTIRDRMEIACVVVHPRKGAAAATKDNSAIFAGPFVNNPKISTGAGDHFNAGFSLGQVLGFGLAESLCVGCGTSGYYVRTAVSPSTEQLAEFVATMPAPQT